MSITFGTTEAKPKTNIGIDNATIISAEVVYNKAQKWQKIPDDVGVEMELDIGKSFNPTFYVGGFFKKDDVSGNVVGWGTGFKVKILLDSIGLTGAKLDKTKPAEHQRFPENTGDLIVGKRFARLSYKTTKAKDDGNHYWRDWQQVAPENHFEELRTAFMDAATRVDPSTGQPAPYIKDYLFPETEEAQTPDLSGPWDDEETATKSNNNGAVPKAPAMPNLGGLPE